MRSGRNGRDAIRITRAGWFTGCSQTSDTRTWCDAPGRHGEGHVHPGVRCEADEMGATRSVSQGLDGLRAVRRQATPGPGVMLLVGTAKGMFILESDAKRTKWARRDPYHKGWMVYGLFADKRHQDPV